MSHLGVEDDADGLVLDRALINVDGTQAVGVAHDRYPRAVLDSFDETVAASRDDEVDVAVLRQEGRDFGPG